MLMSSEHISYKSTKKYLATMFTEAPWVIQGPGENAGIVDIGNGYCIALRIESHNHPIFISFLIWIIFSPIKEYLHQNRSLYYLQVHYQQTLKLLQLLF